MNAYAVAAAEKAHAPSILKNLTLSLLLRAFS